jgi:energy-coupling factor transporter ATP-binding protein EcfA2
MLKKASLSADLQNNMMEYQQEIFDARFRQGSCMIVVGPTNAGKTTFVKSLIQHRNALFDKAPARILWFYSTAQSSVHSELRQLKVQLIQGFPGENFASMLQPNDLVVVDDLIEESSSSASMRNVFTGVAHHLPCFVIVLSQNIFFKGKELRTISLNAMYFVLLKNPRDQQQIAALGRQCFTERPGFLLSVYKKFVMQQAGRGAHLLLDFHPSSSDRIRLRARVLPGQQPHLVFA